MRIKVIILLLFVISPYLSLAQDSTDFFSAKNRLRFGDFLYCSKDYLRAIDEYAEYLKKFNNDTIVFKISLALRKMKKYSQAEDYFKTLAFNSPLNQRARIELFKTYFIEKDFGSFSAEMERRRFFPEAKPQPVISLYYSSQLLWSKTLPDSVEFISAFESGVQKKMAEFYAAKNYPDIKDETTAGVLSALIPGLGKIYTGEYGDGITAFIFNSVLGFLAYDNYRAGHKFRTWLFGGMTMVFYAGNIYGSVASAQLYNVASEINFRTRLNDYIKSKNYFDDITTEFCK